MGRILCLLAAATAFGLPCFAQKVTDTRRVSVGGGNTELLRKINGRWWTQDNRLVYPPKSSGMIGFWTVSSKQGVVDFYHHRPFDVRRAEQLRLFMTTDEVEAAFGQPNRIFAMGSGRSGRWYYHGVDGTILDLWFMEREELGQAEYQFPVGDKRPVASIERELNGRSIFSLMAQRATELASQQRAGRRSGPQLSSGSDRSVAEVAMRHAAEPAHRAEKRIVDKQTLESVQPGITREALMQRLGEPTSKSVITSDDGVKETFTYHLDERTPVSVRLLNGKVVEVR